MTKEARAMTTSQSIAIWEMYRQGYPLAAEEAADHWEKGEAYEPHWHLRVSRQIGALIDQCNWEVSERPPHPTPGRS
jgi:hypothetical protein